MKMSVINELTESHDSVVVWNGDLEYNHHAYLTQSELAMINWGRYLSWVTAGKLVSERFNVSLDCIAVGCRLEMFLAILAALARNHWRNPRIGTLSPSYVIAFNRLADAFDLPVTVSFLSDDFSIDMARIVQDFTNLEGMVWLCNPNNPTGTMLQPQDIAMLATKMPKNLIVVDESYVDSYPALTAIPLLKNTPNLIVLRTLSKGPGLPASWSGYALFGSVEWCRYVKGVIGDYVSAASVEFLRAVFNSPEVLEKNLIYRMNEKARIQAELEKLGILFQPTVTPFLLGQLPNKCNPDQVYEEIRSWGVCLSTFKGAFPASPGHKYSPLDKMFRITPVDAESNTRGICVIREVMDSII